MPLITRDLGHRELICNHAQGGCIRRRRPLSLHRTKVNASPPVTHIDLGSDELSQLCLFCLCPGAASRLWTCHSEKLQMKVLIQSQQARFRKGLGLAQTSTARGNWATCGGNRGLAEAPLCRKGRYAPPVHMVKLTS